MTLSAEATDLNLSEMPVENVGESSDLSLWRETFNIRSYQVGPTGLVTPQALCRFLQEAASNHAQILDVGGEKLAQKNLMWVLSRLRLRMQGTPKWRERLTVETWPSKRTKGVRAHRDFRLFQNGQQIGDASSIWLLLSKSNRRPMRIPEFLEMSRLPGLSEDLLENSEVEAVAQTHFQKQYEVLASDLDFNNHVGNVCYLEWALNSLPYEIIESRTMSELLLNFLAEGQYGDRILARTQTSGSTSELDSGLDQALVCRHSLETVPRGQRLAAIETVWL